MSDVLCELVGGPYDGDDGRVNLPLPAELWVWTCGDSGCPHGGVHWALRARPDTPLPLQRYVQRGVRERGDEVVHLYVHGDRLPPPAGSTRDVERDPVLA